MRVVSLYECSITFFGVDGVVEEVKEGLFAKGLNHLTELADASVMAAEAMLDRVIVLTNYTADLTEDNIKLTYHFQDDGAKYAEVVAAAREFQDVPSPRQLVEQLKQAIQAAQAGSDMEEVFHRLIESSKDQQPN
jgi:hypothetical protein